MDFRLLRQLQDADPNNAFEAVEALANRHALLWAQSNGVWYTPAVFEEMREAIYQRLFLGAANGR